MEYLGVQHLRGNYFPMLNLESNAYITKLLLEFHETLGNIATLYIWHCVHY